jgi:hypothetical protein
MKLGTVSTVSKEDWGAVVVVVIVDGSFQHGDKSTGRQLLTVRSVICSDYITSRVSARCPNADPKTWPRLTDHERRAIFIERTVGN